MLKLIVGLFLFSLNTNIFAQNTNEGFDQFANEVFKKIQMLENNNDCSSKIWPGLSWKEKNVSVVILSKTDQNAKIWDSSTNAISAFDYSLIPNHSKGLYGRFVIDQDREIITLEHSAILKRGPVEKGYTFSNHVWDATDVLYHEGFHFYWQKDSNWKPHHLSDQLNPRGELFPFNLEARYLREIMIRSLHKMLSDKENQEVHFNQALLAYNDWSKNFSHENRTIYDREEGSAQYVGKMAYALAAYQCNVESFDKSSMEWLLSLDPPETPSLISASYEYYILGFLSGIALNNLSDNSWKMRVAQEGKSPLEVLFENKESKGNLFDQIELKEQLAAVNNVKNELFKERLESIINNIEHQEVYFVSLPKWNPGFFHSEGFFTYQRKNFNGDFLGISLRKSKTSYKKDDSLFIIKKGSHTISFTDGPCEQNTYIVVHKNEIQNLDNISIENNLVQLNNVPIESKHTENRFDFLCTREI